MLGVMSQVSTVSEIDTYDVRWATAALAAHDRLQNFQNQYHQVSPFQPYNPKQMQHNAEAGDGLMAGFNTCFEQLFDQYDLKTSGSIPAKEALQLTQDLLTELGLSADIEWKLAFSRGRDWSKSAYKLWFLANFVWKNYQKQDTQDANSPLTSNPLYDELKENNEALGKAPESKKTTVKAEYITESPPEFMTMDKATKLSDLKKADQELFAKKFTQYDLDGSGFIEHDEMKQLCINLAFGLGIVKGFDMVMQQQESLTMNCNMDVEQFAAWFLATFDFVDTRDEGGGLEIIGTKL